MLAVPFAIRKSSFTALRSTLHVLRSFTDSRTRHVKQMPPRPKIVEEDLQEAFLKGSGPGGQKINKTSSAVQLKHIPSGIVVKCQSTRSRSQNRKIARTFLAEKLEFLEKGSESRIAIKGEVKRKKKASKEKKSKRKYRALEEAKASAIVDEVAESDEDVDIVDASVEGDVTNELGGANAERS